MTKIPIRNVYRHVQCTPLISFFFCKFGGGDCFCVEKKCVKHPKTNKICYCWGGKVKTWVGFLLLKDRKIKHKEKTPPLIALSLFRVTMLNYCVGCKPQKATKNTINSVSANLIWTQSKCIPAMIIVAISLLLYLQQNSHWDYKLFPCMLKFNLHSYKLHCNCSKFQCICFLSTFFPNPLW